MPGIVGVVSRQPASQCRDFVQTMLGTLVHERFYATGTHSCSDLGVYVGWAAHEGSYSAQQSSANGSSRVSLAFAGECFPALSNGQLSSDDVDIVRRYRAEGVGFIASLNGLFSGVIIDREQRRAVLFNDRYAAERVYYHERPDTVFFASEAKAILAVAPETRAFDERGVAQFLAYGSTEGERTMFRRVVTMPGGSAWHFEPNLPPKKSRYFVPSEWEQQPTIEANEFEAKFAETAQAVMPNYGRAESPVGLSITGGLDTRMIMAGIGKSDPRPICYTYAGLTGEPLDVRIGRRVSQALGLQYHTLRISKEFVANFGTYLDRTVRVTDGCAGALTTHEIFFSALAREISPIRLTGNFGSEILRSMSTLKPKRLASDLIDPSFRSLLDQAMIRETEPNAVTQSAFREVPMHLFGALAAGRSQVTVRTPYLDNAIVRLAYQAPADSRRSPAAAWKLIKTNATLAGIPTDRGLVADATNRVAARRLFCEVTFKLDWLDKEGLPGELNWLAPLFGALSRIGLMGLHKFLPYRKWFRSELADYVSDTLAASRTRSLLCWNRRFLNTLARNHVLGRANYMDEINCVLTLEAVDRLLLGAFPRGDQPSESAR